MRSSPRSPNRADGCSYSSLYHSHTTTLIMVLVLKPLLLNVAIGMILSRSTSALYSAYDYYGSKPCQVADEFVLFPETTCSRSITCAADDWHGHIASSSSCESGNFFAHGQKVFGDSPFVVTQVYDDKACTTVNHVIGRRLYDGMCIMTSSTASFKILVRADWAVDTEYYSSSDCTGSPTSVDRRSSDDVRSSACINSITYHIDTRASFNPWNGFIADTFYTDYTCAVPNRLRFFPVMIYDKVASMAQSCAANKDGVFYKREIVYDYKEYTKKTFMGSTPYMIEEGFKDGNCGIDNFIAVFRADDSCIKMDRISGKFHLMDDSYDYNLYMGGTCDGEWVGMLRNSPNYWNGACSNYRKFYPHHPEVQTSTPSPSNTSTPEPSTPATTSSASGLHIMSILCTTMNAILFIAP